MKDKVIYSPIRWAGSKKKILNDMLKFFDNTKDNYIECFLGSGVVLINVLDNIEVLKYKKLYVNDINPNIIGFYELIKNNKDQLIKELLKKKNVYDNLSDEDREKFYYEIRARYNDLDKCEEKYILFYLLMKLGYNGVYRENSLGKFNVPFGRKDHLVVNEELLIKISELIQNVEFYNMDYKDFIYMLKEKGVLKKSFIYCDPPYISEDKAINKNITMYTKDAFDHEEFIKFLIDSKANSVMISMSYSKEADKIYIKDKFKKKDITEILRTVNPTIKFRSQEIAYINYEINIKED